MSDLTSDERFRSSEHYAQHKHNDRPFMVAYTTGGVLLTFEDCDLDVTQARALREWLNEVIP